MTCALAVSLAFSAPGVPSDTASASQGPSAIATISPLFAAPQPSATIEPTAVKVAAKPKPVRKVTRAKPRPKMKPKPQTSRSEVRLQRTGSPKAYAASRLSGTQYRCLVVLWNRESGWNPRADNPTSSAYGIPQALPGSKMASAGSDWRTNPITQVKWGLGYIAGRYGSPCNALGHSNSHGWY